MMDEIGEIPVRVKMLHTGEQFLYLNGEWPNRTRKSIDFMTAPCVSTTVHMTLQNAEAEYRVVEVDADLWTMLLERVK